MEKIEKYATDGEEFQQYVYSDRTDVKDGEIVGFEYKNSKGDWVFKLMDGIFYA